MPLMTKAREVIKDSTLKKKSLPTAFLQSRNKETSSSTTGKPEISPRTINGQRDKRALSPRRLKIPFTVEK